MASSATDTAIAASVTQQRVSERTMAEEQAEEDAASSATVLVEQTTLTLPEPSRTSNILLSQDQLLYITRPTSHGSDDDDCDESAYDISVDDETSSCHHVIHISKDLPGSSGASVSTPTTVSLSRASTGAFSASALPPLTKRSSSAVSLGDPASSQPGAQHVRGVEYTTSSDDECADDERLHNSNSPNVTTATVISQDELEAQIRQKVLQEAVVAQVVDPESPSEPAKPDVKEPPKKRSKRQCLLMVLFLLTSVASAIATALAMKLRDDDDDLVEELEAEMDRERENEKGPDGLRNDGSDEPFSGTSNMNEADDYDENSEDAESLMLLDILSTKSPNVTVFDSPQHKAFQWMFRNDIYDPTDDFFWEYYALVTLFFATNGNTTWRRRDNWLNPNVSPCDWYPGTLCRTQIFSRNQGTRHLSENHDEYDEPPLSIASLDLGSNDLDGTVPEELALLSTLQLVILDDNPLLLGSLISNFSSLSSLQHFSARRVGFIGTFPPGLEKLTQLQTFELQGDSGMSGATFPSELWSLPSLRILSLEGVGVTGTIPQTTICPNEVYLNDNQLSGELPVLTSQDWQELEVLDLRNNRLTGTLPSELSNLWDRNLLVLRLEGNDFEGEVAFCESYQQSIERTGSSHLLSADCADDFFYCSCCTVCCTEGNNCQPQSTNTRARQ